MHALPFPHPSPAAGDGEQPRDGHMSRKRSLHEPESPRAKRHLNSALASELQTLRISQDPTQRYSTQRNAFGGQVNSSPFLAPSDGASSAPGSCPTDSYGFGTGGGVSFGADFMESLSNTSQYQQSSPTEYSPEVITPDSSTSTMSMVDDGSQSASTREKFERMTLSMNQDDVIIEDMEAPINSENRIVVYRPPVRTSSKTLSKLNASLPDGRYVFRNPRADEWVVKEVQNERMKRKMALVPWKGNVKKLCEPVHNPSKAIPMPWHDTEKPSSSSDSEQNMELEDISP